MKVTWPEVSGPSLIAGVAYVCFATGLTLWLWLAVHIVAGLIAGVVLAAVAWTAAESHLATQRLRRPLESLQRDQGQDPEDTWTS